MTAVVHIGPHKTASTTIQSMLRKVLPTLEMDNYAMPGDWSAPGAINMQNLAPCFWKDELPVPADKKCDTMALQDIDLIASQRQNVLLTAESLSYSIIDLTKVKETLKPWNDNTVIVTYYRRFFEWLISYYNMETRYRSVPNRVSFVEWVADLDDVEAKFSNTYTYSVVGRWKEYFSNVLVYNMHDTTSKIVEEFFCDAMPNATNTCDAVVNRMSKNGEKHFNPSIHTLVYSELAYTAYQMELLTVVDESNIHWDDIIDKIQQRQEIELGLNSTEFSAIICPDTTILDAILEKTLMVENEMFPDFFQSNQGEIVIKEKFEQAKTDPDKLCSIDVKRVLVEDFGWREFFKSL
jgi:hypothetical protein